MTSARVLVVEDEGIVAADLAVTLEELGYEVPATTSSGEQAIRLCRELGPDIVLMDIVLAGQMDGIEAARRILSSSDIALVYLTAHTEPDLFQRAKLTGSYGYLTKPVSPRELQRTIETALYKHSMERRLRRSEERLQLALEGAGLGLWDWNLRTGETVWDKNFLANMGYDKDEMEPTFENWKRFTHPDDWKRVVGALKENIEGLTEELEIEYRVLTKQESWRWILMRGKVLERDSEGTAIRMAGIILDVTERRRTQRALKESELRLRTVFDTTPDAIVISRLPDGTIVDANGGFTNITGYSLEEVKGQSPGQLRIWAEVDDLRTFLKTLAETGEVNNFQSRFRLKDGRIVTALISARVISLGGEQYVLSVTREIDEWIKARKALQESERRFRTLVEAARDVIWTTSLDLQMTYVSPAVTDVLGYTVEEIMAMGPLETLTPQSRDRALSAFREEMEKEQPVPRKTFTLRLEDLEHVRKDGRTIWMEVSATFLRDAEGNPVGVLGISHDITHRKRAEEELKRAHDLLEERVKVRTGELAAANEELVRRLEELRKAQSALTASEERFRAIVETAPDCIYMKDTSLKYTFVNPGMLEVFGLDQSEILGRGDEDLFGKEVGAHLREVDLRVLKGEVVEEEHTRPAAGVPTTFLDIRAPMRNAKGDIVGICGISRNITERRNIRPPDVSRTIEQYPSKAMRSALTAARLAAETDTIVLLTGESGSGKDHLAHYIHDNSRRASGPFIAVNCAAIPSELAESELFGHERGAFTGATRRKRGLFELAEGGTLLLNELGDLSLSLQTKLLAFLDTRSFTRVGGERSITANARLMAATNRDLEVEVSKGTFREDLFYRLNVFSIRLPPLRSRTEDIPLLVEEITAALSAEMQMSAVPKVSSEAMEKLIAYPWPGNVRELRNTLEAALILSGGSLIKCEHLRFPEMPPNREQLTVPLSKDKPLFRILDDIERTLIEEALEQSRGKRADAARRLGISRFALTRHMKKLGIGTDGGVISTQNVSEIARR